MPTSINEKLIDQITVHQIDLERFKANEARSIVKILNQLEKDLKKDIIEFDPTAVGATSYRQKRLQALLKQTQATLGTHYRRINKETKASMVELAETEGEYHRSLINKMVGVEIASVAITPQMLKSIAGNVMIRGTKAEDWWKRAGQDTQRRFEDTIRQGMLRGEPLESLVRRVRGTKKNDYKDGIMRATRSDAVALIRTSVQTVANDARNELYAANDDVIKAVQQISTLDSRTTPICIQRSNKVWSLPDYKPVDHDIPWNGGPGGTLHFGCRSTTVPVLKSWNELGAEGIRTEGRTAFDQDAYFKKRLRARLESEYADEIEAGAEKGGLPIEDWISEQVDSAIMKAQASMDGVVSESLDYESWLKSKSVEFQQEVLGQGKWKLWSEGKITFADLVDETGRPLTLAELKEKVGDIVPVVSRNIYYPQYDESNVRDWRQNAQNVIAERARNLTPSEFKSKVKQNIANLIDQSKVCIRVDGEDVMNSILDDGRFKSQFETGTSGGALSPSWRCKAESTLFGYDNDLPARDRPIYGYLGDEQGLLNSLKDNVLDMYGKIKVVMKNDIKNRATLMCNDSLGLGLNPHGSNGIPTPLLDIDIDYILGSPGLQSSDVDRLINPIESTGKLTPKNAYYPEVQMHDGVNIDMIEEIIFPNKPEAETVRKLRDLDIKYRYYSHGRLMNGN